MFQLARPFKFFHRKCVSLPAYLRRFQSRQLQWSAEACLKDDANKASLTLLQLPTETLFLVFNRLDARNLGRLAPLHAPRRPRRVRALSWLCHAPKPGNEAAAWPARCRQRSRAMRHMRAALRRRPPRRARTANLSKRSFAGSPCGGSSGCHATDIAQGNIFHQLQRCVRAGVRSA